MKDAPISVPLLPGERLLFEQPVKSEYAELNSKNLPETAARCALLLLFPASLCVFMASELFSLIWLGLSGGALVAETVCYVRRKRRSCCSVRVTSERVICMRQVGEERRCRVYPHRCLCIQPIGTKLWFYAGADEHIPMVDTGENAPQLARLIQRETVFAAPAVPEPLDERHPLLPEGELLYATGQHGKKEGIRAWLWLGLGVAFYLSVAVAGWMHPPDAWPVWLGWGAQAGILVHVLVVMIRNAIPEPFAIGSGGIYTRYGCEGMPDMNRPYTLMYHADGTVSALFSVPVCAVSFRIYLWNTRCSCDMEHLLRCVSLRHADSPESHST